MLIILRFDLRPETALMPALCPKSYPHFQQDKTQSSCDGVAIFFLLLFNVLSPQKRNEPLATG